MMTTTEDELRLALSQAAKDVHLSGDLERFLPPARRRRRPRAGALALLVIVVLGTAAATGLPPLLSGKPDTVQRLFLRTTRQGVDIRAYAFSGDFWQGLEGDLSSNWAAGLVLGSYTTVPPRRVRAEATAIFGSDGHDAMAVVVRAGDKVALVRASFTSGASDSMHPVKGWAVLAGLGSVPGGRVDAYDAQGHLLDQVRVPKPTNLARGGPSQTFQATFVRRTHQGLLVVGRTIGTFLYPDIAGPYFVQVGYEGLGICRPTSPTGLAPGVDVLSGDAYPPGSMGPPITLVVVHSGNDIARVAVVFANHVSDSMAPVDGEAILATLGTVADNGELQTMPQATVYGFDKQGRRVASVALTPESNGDCWPPVQ